MKGPFSVKCVSQKPRIYEIYVETLNDRGSKGFPARIKSLVSSDWHATRASAHRLRNLLNSAWLEFYSEGWHEEPISIEMKPRQ